MIAHVKKLDYQLDTIVYAGDDVRRFSQKGRNLFTKLGKFAEHGVLAVIGNDDTSNCKQVLNGKNVHDLHEEPYIVDEFAFIGQEGATGDIGLVLYSEDEVNKHLENQMKVVPENKTIILVSHSPPFGILDFARRFGTRHIGSRSILNFLEKYEVTLNICGHVHMYGGRSEKLGDTRIVNIASGDEPEAQSKIANILIPRKDSLIDRPLVRCFTIEEREIRGLRGVGKVRSSKLVNSGFTSLEKIASKEPANIDRKTGIGPKIVWLLWLSARAIVDDEIFQIDDFASPEDPLYLDVETTPEARFMTGTYYPKEGEFKQFTVKKWTAGERRKTGRALQRFLEDRGKTIVTYTDYDIGFLSPKMLKGKEHYDLYVQLKRSFVLPSQNYQLSSVGKVFGYTWKDPSLTGWDMPSLYSDYLRTGKVSYLKKIEEHNKDDVMAMSRIVREIENSEFQRKNFGEEIVERLNKLASELGRIPRGNDDESIYNAALRYFGSWNEAKKIAGLESSNC